jgi:hypothetical protein
LLQREIPVPARVARSLRALDRETLRSELGELLSKDQIHGIEKRCPLLVQELEGRGLLPPPD